MMTLFQLRKQMEMKQNHPITGAAIAHLAGISPSAYCRYETGKNIPNILVAANLARALGLALPDLVEIIRATVEQDHAIPPADAEGDAG